MTNKQAIEQLKRLQDLIISALPYMEGEESINLAINALEGQNEKKEEWPKYGEDYYCITEFGKSWSGVWNGVTTHIQRKNFLGVFKTQERADLKRDVIKALANAKPWVPKEGEAYVYWKGWLHQNIGSGIWGNHISDKSLLAQGNIFPNTPEGRKRCEEYGALMMREAEEIIKENS